VIQSRGEPGLAEEAVSGAVVPDELFREHLHRDSPAELRIARPVHESHAAGAEELL
jgi:hypothetical protein